MVSSLSSSQFSRVPSLRTVPQPSYKAFSRVSPHFGIQGFNQTFDPISALSEQADQVTQWSFQSINGIVLLSGFLNGQQYCLQDTLEKTFTLTIQGVPGNIINLTKREYKDLRDTLLQVAIPKLSKAYSLEPGLGATRLLYRLVAQTMNGDCHWQEIEQVNHKNQFPGFHFFQTECNDLRITVLKGRASIFLSLEKENEAPVLMKLGDLNEKEVATVLHEAITHDLQRTEIFKALEADEKRIFQRLRLLQEAGVS